MFLFIDNYDSFTYNLIQAFQTLGEEPVVVYNDDPRLLDYATDPALQAVCIGPGPSHPLNSGYCLEFLKRLNPEVPVLGVCLGHQILGLFAGGEVKRAPQPYHGKASDIVHDGEGIFHGLPNPLRVGRYHSLVVKEHEAYSVMARAPEGEVMALRYNDRPWVGVQFHPESILTPDGALLLANFPGHILPDASLALRMKNVLNTLADGKDLTPSMANFAFDALMDGRLPPVQAGSLLMGLRLKGETPIELAQAARAALARAVRLDAAVGTAIDIVGTGGDGRDSFNCSTATALTLAGMGYPVVKHGNRAITSVCGSADVLERLGIPINIPATAVPAEVARTNFAFLFAPHYHPAFRNIEPVRKDVGFRTLFNLLGPLINPARPAYLLLGVARENLLELMSETLAASAVRRAAVVCGAGGYDEVSPLGVSKLILVRDGVCEAMEIDPAEFGIAPCAEKDLQIESAAHGEAVLRELLNGGGSAAMRDMLTLNVAVALYLLNENMPLAVCMAKAREAIASGAGRKLIPHAA